MLLLPFYLSLRKCHSEAVWWYFLSFWVLRKTTQMVNLSLCSPLSEKCEYIRHPQHFYKPKNCDHTVTLHEKSWWVISHPVVDTHYVSAVLSELKLQRLDLAQTLGSPIWFWCVKIFFFLIFFIMFHQSRAFYLNMGSVCSVLCVLLLWVYFQAVPVSVCVLVCLLFLTPPFTIAAWLQLLLLIVVAKTLKKYHTTVFQSNMI